VSRTWGKDLPDVIVNVAGRGTLDLLHRQLRTRAGRSVGEIDTAEVWESCTPFVAPRFVKARGTNSLVGQVRSECRTRGLPEPDVEVLSRDEVVARHFLRFVTRRRSGRPQPPTATPWALRLRFPVPVTGPISLGYASHFGLGLFATACPSPDAASGSTRHPDE
jgi:CRISPR-associated protein Csb2